MSQKYLKAFLKALKTEYSFYPSLGLVSKRNSGSHTDMNYATFVKSSKVFKPYLQTICKNYDQIKSFSVLKEIGWKFEQKMFAQTNNINTHKGLIFCGGIFYYSFLKSQRTKTPLLKCLQDFNKSLQTFERPKSFSQQLCDKHNLWHAIDYAIDGYKIVFSGLDFWKSLQTLHLSKNLKYFTLLLYLVINLDDTTLITKIGYENWLELKNSYKEFLNKVLTKSVNKKQIEEFNQTAIQQRVSPGGCADIFVLIMFLDKVNYS